MGSIKKLAGETVLYGASSVLGRVLNYLLVPLYTSVFVAEEYGIVTELYAYVAFLNIIYAYGLETAYFRFSNKEGFKEQNVFNISFSSILVTTLVFSGFLFLMSEEISLILDYPGQSHLISWLAIILGIDAIVAIPFARLRLEGKAKMFVLAKLTNISLNILFNLLFIIIIPSLTSTFLDEPLKGLYRTDWGIEYIFISNLLANALLIPILVSTFKGFRFRYSLTELQPLLIYAYPLLFTGLAGVTNEMMSRAMLKHLLPEGFYPGQSNLTALGIFGACYKLSVFMTLAVQAFRYAAEPFFFSNAADKESPQLFARVAHWFVIFASLAFLVISINLDLIGFIFLRAAEYREALYVVPYLLLGGLFLGIYYNLSVWYKLSDKTIYGALISGIGALITIIINIVLIPTMGYLGSAIATLITYATMTVISYYLGQKYLPIPYKAIKGLTYIGMAALLVLILAKTEPGSTAFTMIMRTAAVSIFIFVFYLLDGSELNKLLKRSN